MAADEIDAEDWLLIGIGALIGVQLFRFLQTQGGFSFPASAPGGTANVLSAIPMHISPSGRAFIQSNEKFSLTAYPDANGQSIYWGHHIKPGDPPINNTLAQANQFFDEDIAYTENLLNLNVTVPLNQDQFDALGDLAYNIPKALTPGKSTLLSELNAGNYAGAAQQILAWNKSGGKTLPALQQRRTADAARFNSTA